MFDYVKPTICSEFYHQVNILASNNFDSLYTWAKYVSNTPKISNLLIMRYVLGSGRTGVIPRVLNSDFNFVKRFFALSNSCWTYVNEGCLSCFSHFNGVHKFLRISLTSPHLCSLRAALSWFHKILFHCQNPLLFMARTFVLMGQDSQNIEFKWSVSFYNASVDNKHQKYLLS